jgi:hypothetical protein
MPRKNFAEPPWPSLTVLRAETHSAEQPVAAFFDEWRQIDRWVNEGGAENRTRKQAEQISRSRQP